VQLDPQVALAINRIDGQSQPTTPQPTDSERGNLKDKLTSTYGIKTWTDDRALSRNPFVFKNEVVALFTVFNKMLVADQALFVHNEPIIAVEAPTTLFPRFREVSSWPSRLSASGCSGFPWAKQEPRSENTSAHTNANAAPVKRFMGDKAGKTVSSILAGHFR